MSTASARRSDPGIDGGVVSLTIGKTRSLTFRIDRGQVMAAAPDAEIDLTVPVKTAQLESLVAGDSSWAQEFMRGDLKPVGATGVMVSLVEVFDDPEFRSAFAELERGL